LVAWLINLGGTTSALMLGTTMQYLATQDTTHAVGVPLATVLPAKIDAGARWLFRLAAFVVLVNLFDGVLTLALVSGGLATEANPMMAELLGRGAMHFMLYKIALVSLSVLLCWRLRHARMACVAIYGAAATYGMLGLYHIKSIDVLARYIA